MLSKIKTILLSRLKHNKEEEWVIGRRQTCLGCEYNTLNGGILKGYRFFLAIGSSLYSKLMGQEKVDVLGECSACGCSIYYKSETFEDDCVKGRWKKLEDGSMKLDIISERKLKHLY